MKLFRICFLIGTAVCTVCCTSKEVDYSSYVDVKIGSGYHSSDSTVIGFSQTHVSGTGDGDMDDVLLMPVTGRNLTYARGDYDSQESGL